MLIYVNITDRRSDGHKYQKYKSEPHKIKVCVFFKFETHGEKNLANN